MSNVLHLLMQKVKEVGSTSAQNAERSFQVTTEMITEHDNISLRIVRDLSEKYPTIGWHFTSASLRIDNGTWAANTVEISAMISVKNDRVLIPKILIVSRIVSMDEVFKHGYEKLDSLWYTAFAATVAHELGGKLLSR